MFFNHGKGNDKEKNPHNPHNPPTRKLGKKEVRLDSRTFKMESYLPITLPTTPAEVSWITKLVAAETLPMFLNDQLGICVPAAAAHMIQQWNFYAGHPKQPTNTDVLRAYEAVGGYVLGDPSTDNGTDMLSFLNYWRNTGVGGHKILAYASVNPKDKSQVMSALQLFGNLYVGLGLPMSAASQTAWTVPTGGVTSQDGQPYSWGGHCVPIAAASPGSRTCITWGGTLKMSPNFFLDYCDEAYVVLSNEWIAANGLAPSQFNLSQLKADLASL